MPYIFKAEFPINVESPYFIEERAEMLEQAGILEHKWKMLGKWVYCYNYRAVYSATRKCKFGDEISINSLQRKHARQTL
jgi:hypothetical protein